MAVCAGPCYKIIIIGNIGVGKTTLFHRVLFGKYDDDFRSTIGFDCFEKTVTVHGESIRVIMYLFMYIYTMYVEGSTCMYVCVCTYMYKCYCTGWSFLIQSKIDVVTGVCIWYYG